MKCHICKQEKELTDMVRDKRLKIGFRKTCRSCNAKSTKEYNTKNPTYQKEYKLRTLYNLSSEEWQNKFVEQNGCCAICGKHQMELNGPLHTDHNHITGKVRKLLCDKCNRGLGYFDDNKDLLKRATDYLDLEYGK